MARVYANAVEMIGDEERAVQWLCTPNRVLEGERPLDRLDTDVGAREVEDIVGRNSLWRIQLMRFWRICRRCFAAEAATGEGARLYGGRWNSRGVRVVYASSSLALAAMETFCESRAESSAKDLVSIEGDIPDDIETARLDSKSPPSAWYRTRDESLRRFGDAWIDAEQTIAMALPSAAVRGEWNILLNPTHRDFEKVKFGEPEPFNFDPRMFR